jgi:nucleoside-triphosphatase THEP1
MITKDEFDSEKKPEGYCGGNGDELSNKDEMVEEFTSDNDIRKMAAIAKASKEAELEYKRKQREAKNDKYVEERVTFISQMKLTDEDAEIFHSHAIKTKAYVPVIWKARYKKAYAKKYEEGYLVELTCRFNDDSQFVIDAGGLHVNSTYRGVRAKILGVNVNPDVITYKNKMYLEVNPGIDGLLGLGALVAASKGDLSLLSTCVIKILEVMLEQKEGDVDLAGADELVDKCYRVLTTDDARVVNRHLLLAGPPGCGKSMIAKKLIKMTPELLHFNVTSNMNWSEIIPMLDLVLKWCNKKVLIIVDEIDEMGLNRDMSRDQVYQLLRILDGTADLKNVKFLATTNRPGDLDAALLRPGRLGPVFVVDRPNREQIKSILGYYNMKFRTNVSTEKISAIEGLTGCDIRTAYEDCVIYGMELTTENVDKNLRESMKAKNLNTTMFA